MANQSHNGSWDEEVADFFPSLDRRQESEPRLYKLWDLNQKFFFLMMNVLVADVRNSNSQVQMMTMIPNTSIDPKQKPVFLGLEKTNSSLSCVRSGNGQYKIELKEKDIMDLYRNPRNAKAFSFYSRSAGKANTCSFESAEFPGFFLSTSPERNKPVGLSQKGGPQNILFHFKRK